MESLAIHSGPRGDPLGDPMGSARLRKTENGMRTRWALAWVTLSVLSLSLTSAAPAARAQAKTPEPAAPADAPAADTPAGPDTTAPGSDDRLRLEIEKARAEAERARADAERARAEAEKAKAEAERMRLERARVESGQEEEVDATPAPGYQEHDGFFLRLAIGPGFGGYVGSGTAKVANGLVSFSDPTDKGFILGLPFAIGSAVATDLILHLQFRVDTPPVDESSVRLDVNTGVVGPGVTRYFMPFNVFVTASVGLAFTWYDLASGYDSGNTTHHGDTKYAYGVGVEAMVGKEWWVSANWGLGMAFDANYGYSANEDVTFHTYGMKVLFTATYN